MIFSVTNIAMAANAFGVPPEVLGHHDPRHRGRDRAAGAGMSAKTDLSRSDAASFVLLDDSLTPDGRCLLFEAPVEVVRCDRPEDSLPLFAIGVVRSVVILLTRFRRHTVHGLAARVRISRSGAGPLRPRSRVVGQRR